MIRVGRRVGNKDPSYPGFTPILSLTKSTKYGDISPYVLRTDEGYLVENAYQFSKVYQTVPYSKQIYSRFDSRVIWEHPAEVHVVDGVLTDAYFNWQSKGFLAEEAIRYPVGIHNRHTCIGTYVEGEERLLNYIESRHKVYLPLMYHALQKAPMFHKLVARLRAGENLLIIEIDGPHQESLPYYQEKYGVDDTWIVNNTIEATYDNLNIMLDDAKHPFGHGYCIAWALLDAIN